MEPSPCEVKESCLGGKGTYATRNLGANTLLFRELAFLSAGEAPSHRLQHHDGRPSRRSTLRATPCLSTITVQHKHCPPCARLAPTDSGGSLSGSQDTYDFARAYLASPVANRQRVLGLAAFGGEDTHAIVEVVQAEVGLLRSFDAELREIPASELESAIHRYWANCMGQEGSLYERGSRFNHSCAANCTRVSRSGVGGSERAFVTLRPVSAGEELTLSYLPSAMEVMGTVVRRRHLWLSRGFLCCCSRCSQRQDGVRQVECPQCCRADGRRQQRNRDEEEEEEQAEGGSRTAETPPAADGSLSEEGRRSSRNQAVFADWWSQSETWVCQSCGWYSEVGTCTSRDGSADAASLRSLHHKEGVLSAEVFALVMAGGRAGRDDAGRSKQADERRARRGTLQRLLEASVALLGRRHWATFSCALMRLQQELLALRGEGSELPPASSRPSPPRLKPEFLDWAMRELNALWQWLKVALDAATSHPPEYYLFDVVCDLLDLSGACGSPEKVRLLVSRVESWVAVFADEEQHRRFAACRLMR